MTIVELSKLSELVEAFHSSSIGRVTRPEMYRKYPLFGSNFRNNLFLKSFFLSTLRCSSLLSLPCKPLFVRQLCLHREQCASSHNTTDLRDRKRMVFAGCVVGADND